MLRFRTITSLLGGSLIAGCTTLAHRGSAQEELLSADRQWSAVAAQGQDVERIVSFWSEDALVIPPGGPVIRGMPAIRNYVRQSLAIPGFRIRWNPDQASLSSDGTLGYTRGENTVTFPGSDGKLTSVVGRYVTVWRRGPDRRWKCVIDIWNLAT